MIAKSTRRACLTALREQYARLESPILSPVLPPPRFKVEFCPFADKLRKDLKQSKSSTLRAKRAFPTTSTMTGRSARNAMHASPSLLTLDSLRTDVSSSHHILPWTQWRPTTKRISRVIAATKPSTIHTPSSTTFSRSRSAVRGVACDCPYKEAQAGS